jgi:hypothetical protein
LCSEIHKLINFVWNVEELSQQWKEPIIVPIYRRSDKTYSSYYRGTLILPTTYKILSNILVSRITPRVEEIIGVHHCGCLHNRSTSHQIFSAC